MFFHIDCLPIGGRRMTHGALTCIECQKECWPSWDSNTQPLHWQPASLPRLGLREHIITRTDRRKTLSGAPEDDIWKHCGKRRNCFCWTIYPFAPIYQTLFNTYKEILHKCFQSYLLHFCCNFKRVSGQLQGSILIDRWKNIIKYVKGKSSFQTYLTYNKSAANVFEKTLPEI